MAILLGFASGARAEELVPAPAGTGASADAIPGGHEAVRGGEEVQRHLVPEGEEQTLARVEEGRAELERRWYGWQTLLADTSCGGLVLLSIAVTPQGQGVFSTDLGRVSMFGAAGVYALGAPVVHWAHGNTGTGFASLGLRLALPLAGGALGRASATCKQDGMFGGLMCGVGETAVGALVGMLAAVVIDGVALAWEDADERATEREPQAKAEGPKVFFAVDVRRGAIGLGGTF